MAALEGIVHPISAARRVMEKTPHVMLVGDGARCDRGDADAGLFGHGRGDGGAFRGVAVVMIIVMPGLAMAGIRAGRVGGRRSGLSAAAAGERHQRDQQAGGQRGTGQGKRHRRSSVDTVSVAATMLWPVRRWISIRAVCAAMAASSWTMACRGWWCRAGTRSWSARPSCCMTASS